MAAMATALITGATAGLGSGFAESFAKQGYDLVIVARTVSRLEETAQRLKHLYSVDVEVLSADLTDRAGQGLVEARLADADDPVDVLVNNAGFGLKQHFVGGSRDDEQAMLEILITAPMRLTHAALPGMVQRGTGSIINVSSVAGWISAGTYSAAKAWMTTFTEGLAAELHGTGVTATAACPGFVNTEFHDRSGIHKPNLPSMFWLDVDDVVAKAVADSRKGRVVSVTGAPYHVLATLAQYAPRPVVRKVSTMRTR